MAARLSTLLPYINNSIKLKQAQSTSNAETRGKKVMTGRQQPMRLTDLSVISMKDVLLNTSVAGPGIIN